MKRVNSDDDGVMTILRGISALGGLFATGREVDRVGSFEAGRVRVSTVALPFAHGEDDDGSPLIFETMTFLDGTWSDVNCIRYATREEAAKGHDIEVARAVAEYGVSL